MTDDPMTRVTESHVSSSHETVVMTVNLKRRGTRVEWKARRELEAQGYTVVRSAGSLGVFDLMAFNDYETLAIQTKVTTLAKTTPSMFKDDLEAIRQVVVPPGYRKQLWIARDRKGWEKIEL